jgi:tricorn protease
VKKIFVFILLLSFQLAAQNEEYFMSDPALSPDARTIIFSFEGDLWTVATVGGKAQRLTAMDGLESRPAFSPDGKWIAFTSNQDGNNNIYIMPVSGGTVTQLTFHSANDLVESWSWDSKFIYFNSDRYNTVTALKISISGGTPVRLFENYFNWPHNIVEDPITHGYYFNDTWESWNQASRKRYKGDFNPDVKFFNPSTKEYKLLTDFRGKDMWQTVDKNGKIYFASDEANDEYNLYTFENEKKKQLTRFGSSIRKPKVSANGEKVVFEKDYQIFIYDVQSGSAEKVPVNLVTNYKLTNLQEYNTKGQVSNFAASPDGKKIAFVSRGEIFVTDVEGKFVKHINANPNERVIEVVWINNDTILFNQTVKGWLNLFIIKADGKSQEKQLTTDEQNNQAIVVSNDRSKAAYFSGRKELRILDTKKLESSIIAKDEFWALYPGDPSFSPDDRFVAYTAYRNFEQDILVYDFKTEKNHDITKTAVTESSPVWSPDGKYIYFSTDRLKPNYPRGTTDDDIYRIALEPIDKEFKSDRYEKLFQPEKKDSSKVKVEIDFTGLNDRWESIAKLSGSQSNPFVYQKGDETRLLFTSNHEGEGNNLYQTILKPFDKPETKKFEGAKIGGYQISKGKDNFYLLSSSKIYKIDFTANKLTAVEPEEKFVRNLSAEFNQMFYETWSNVEENYYDGNFHGADWNKLRGYYGSFLPYIKSRANLRTLLIDMLGELNSSHMGFNSNGDEEKVFYKTETMETGIIFDDQNPYTVKSILKNSAVWRKGNIVQPGDELIAVNEIEIDKKQNREKYFTTTSLPEEITLKFKRDKNIFEVKVHPQPYNELKTNLYDEWVEKNQKYVEEKSDKKIAYVHMKNMGDGELNNFLIEMGNEFIYKEALIFDLRFNTGGNVHDDVLRFLSQRPYLQWKYRDGKFTLQPNFAPAAKPIVILINEQTLSDAEMTSAGFKELKLGKIIGTESYRWIIFTSGKALVDGSFYRLPSWGCFTLDGKDLELEGVKPDIYVKTTFKDRLEDKDPQLDRAIEEIKKDL